MRDTIDFGIDLGTTNSAIAVCDDGVVTVIKSSEDRDITPSAVWLPDRDTIFVGDRARLKVEQDPKNAFAEFKQDMGLAGFGRHFTRAAVTMTPPQLSAEVLKSLRQSTQLRRGELPDCAVITVPASFKLNQNQATIEAAALAGLGSQCPLVQEPTAAAFAYGLNDATADGYWMVFDFGGGTFDAAVVSKRDGELRVLNHDGDNRLGGKEIDWALVERVLAPAAATALGLPDFRRGNDKWLVNIAKLKAAAERAKIQLSVQPQTLVMEELFDEAGNLQTFMHTLRRDELDAVAEQFYVRAINLCRKALREAALGADDIDRLLLVGGTTLAPGLRERLADPQHGMGIELDVSLDPTTVVARGAAIFASTMRRPQSAVIAPAVGEYGASLAYEPRTTSRITTVAGTLHSSSTVDWTGYRVTIANPAGQPPFRSGLVAVNAKGAFSTEIEVDPHRTSRFTVELTDRTGGRCPLSPDTFSITHGDVEAGDVQLTHSLGIQLHDGEFEPMVRKGAPLPKTCTQSFATAEALRRGDTRKTIRIPLVQGERRRAERNEEVGVLQIRARDLRFDLPKGAKVELTFTVTKSNVLSVFAEVPMADIQLEAEFDFSQLRTQAPEVLEVLLVETQQRMDGLRAGVERGASPEAERGLAELDEENAIGVAREQVLAAKVDPGAAKYAEERLREIQARLDDIEDAAGFTTQAQELQDLLNETAELVDRHGSPGDRQEFAVLTARAEDAIRDQDAAAIRTQTDRTIELLVAMERRAPDWPVKLFYAVQTRVSSSSEADRLVQEGNRAVRAGDMRALRTVNQQLIRLCPPIEQATLTGNIGVVRTR